MRRATLCLILTLLLTHSPAASAGNWPQFRGPQGDGHSTETEVPLKWSESENLAWRVKLPGEGWSSPIVWNDRVFVTCAAQGGKSCHIMAFSRKDGSTLWDRHVFDQELRRKEGKNSYATPTPVTDGQAVYAFYGSGGAAAVSAEDGSVLWVNQDYPFYSQHGLGASPRLFDGILIMPMDSSSDGADKTVGWQTPWESAFVLGLDAKTGKERYKAKRGPSRIAHVTPSITDIGGKPVLVSGAGDVIQGFNPSTGERLWSAYSKGEGVTPSVVIGGGTVFTSSGFGAETIRAVRLDPAAKGDVTQSHILWEQKRGVPMLSSFLYHDGLLYTLKENGILQCLDAKTGEIVWKDRLEGGGFSASPVFAAGRIYFLGENGTTTVIAPGKEFKVLAENPLPGPCQASLAVSEGQIFIRSAKELVCVGKK
jgi:outer membrane protein assembly factor BamB